MAEILKGAPAAAALDEKTAEKTAALRAKGIVPTLAILRVGGREDDVAYERGAMKRCAKLGIEVRSVVLPADARQEELMARIDDLNRDRAVSGVLMFRPLPKHLDEKAACAALSPAKDVDGITAGSMAGVFMGTGEGYPPCTAQSCMEILKYYGVEVCGKRAAVIGRSLVIGRPVAMLLMHADATVTICHTKTKDMPSVVRGADIVVAAAGRAEAITADYFTGSQTVLDVGINWSEAKGALVGDVDFDAAVPAVSAITPVPGGVGSVTTAVLAAHVAEAAGKAAGI
jgi:methylenetetrahydrofolate dehydrogenase (NADP+)/methenyltetrahydrofolate cyclohydrolase